MKWPMRALAITGMLTVFMISRIFEIGAMRATPPSLRISEGTRSSAITAVAPACSAINACSALVTSIMTPPFSISAKPTFNRNVSSILSPRDTPRSDMRLSNHRRRGLRAPGRPGSFHHRCENFSQNRNTCPDLLRREPGEAQTQAAGIGPRYGEVPARQISYVFALRAHQQLSRVERLGQPYPQIHSAL